MRILLLALTIFLLIPILVSSTATNCSDFILGEYCVKRCPEGYSITRGLSFKGNCTKTPCTQPENQNIVYSALKEMRDDKAKQLVVVGYNAETNDVLAVIGVISYLSRLGFWSKAAIHDTDVSLADLWNKNIISIGGPCVNSVTAEIMGLPITWPECDFGFRQGIGRILVYHRWDQTQVIIAGFNGVDTHLAANKFTSNPANYSVIPDKSYPEFIVNTSNRTLFLTGCVNSSSSNNVNFSDLIETFVPYDITTCPEGLSYIDCMPKKGPPNPETNYCTPKNREWIQKNCKIRFYD